MRLEKQKLRAFATRAKKSASSILFDKENKTINSAKIRLCRSGQFEKELDLFDKIEYDQAGVYRIEHDWTGKKVFHKN